MFRAPKRTKAYTNLEDFRPTVRNKPSGLKLDWPRTVSRLSQGPIKHTRSSSSSTPASTSSSLPHSPPPESDHTLSLLAISPPSISRTSQPLFCGDLVPLIDSDRKANGLPANMVCPVSSYCIVNYDSSPPTQDLAATYPASSI